MIKKLIYSILFISVSLFAFDLPSAQSKLDNTTFKVNDSIAGVYKYFDSTQKLWFLYMPNLNYLLIHETGKATVAQGATIIDVSDFSSISVNTNGSVSFGTYSGTDTNALSLSDNTYTIDESMAGLYNYFDSSNKLWFLYMPSLNYLLIHETGKSTVAEGAQILQISSTFESLNASNGNVTFGTAIIEETNTTIEQPPETPSLDDNETEALSTPPSVPSV